MVRAADDDSTLATEDSLVGGKAFQWYLPGRASDDVSIARPPGHAGDRVRRLIQVSVDVEERCIFFL